MLHVHKHSEELLRLIAKTVKGATKWKIVGVTTKFQGLVVIDWNPRHENLNRSQRLDLVAYLNLRWPRPLRFAEAKTKLRRVEV